MGGLQRTKYFIFKVSGKNHLDPVPTQRLPYQRGREVMAAMHTNNPRAIELLKSYIDDHPGDVRALNMYGHILFRSNKYEESKAVYEKILRVVPGDTEALINLAGIAYAMKDQKSGDELVQKAVQLGKMTSALYSQLAFSLLVANMNDESARYYEKAVSLEPRPVDYYNLACAYAKNNHKDEALKALEKSAQLGYGTRQFYRDDPDLN